MDTWLIRARITSFINWCRRKIRLVVWYFRFICGGGYENLIDVYSDLQDANYEESSEDIEASKHHYWSAEKELDFRMTAIKKAKERLQEIIVYEDGVGGI